MPPRILSRVAPLPEPFVLTDHAAAGSPLHRRLVFLALPDDPPAQRLAEAIGDLPGVRLGPGPSQLFSRGIRRIWSSFQQDSDVGLVQLVSAEELLPALRGLTDDLLAPAAEGARVLVDRTPDHADPAAVTAIRSVYPDATVVVRRDVATALPAHARGPGLVVGDDPRDVLPALPTAAGAAPPPPKDAPPGELADRLVVVVGCGRSGTTWLEQLLMTHPRIGGAPRTESWLFQQVGLLWETFDAPGSGLARYADRPQLVRALRRFCDAVLVAARRRHRPGSDFFVEKTPVHSYRLRQIAAVYPDAWVVHLIRDGRDVARSMAQVPFFQVPDPVDAAALWRRVVTVVRGDADAFPRYRELRYEQVFADPVAELADTFGWLGLQVTPEVVDELRTAAAERVSTHAGTAARVGPGSWRALPAATLAGIYRTAGPLLVAEGYATRREVWRGRVGGLSRR